MSNAGGAGRRIIFPQGKMWLLSDGAEVAVADLEGGGLALLVFSDEDLAAAFAEAGTPGKRPLLLDGWEMIARDLRRLRSLGLTHLAIDRDFGVDVRGSNRTISEAISDVERIAGP